MCNFLNLDSPTASPLMATTTTRSQIVELFKAHNQWKSRPQDERFHDLTSMHAACKEYRESACEGGSAYSDLQINDDASGDLWVQGKAGNPARLSHWATGQLCQRVGAPASYIRNLPAPLAAENLNYGLGNRKTEDGEDNAKLLFHKNGALVLRAATSDSYTRIWNSDVTKRLVELQNSNPSWTNPMAYKILEPAKNGAWPTLSGEMEPAGLYASDHDMFAFLVDESKTLDVGPAGMKRGFFTWNSEVGASSFGFMAFCYDMVCGNNIVWGAKNVMEFKIRHVGSADSTAFYKLACELRRFSNSSSSELESVIQKAKTIELGTTREDILDSLFAMVAKVKAPELTKSKLVQALDVAEARTERYGNPNTLWAAVSGLTEASQWLPYADERMKVDKAAGKLLNTIEF